MRTSDICISQSVPVILKISSRPIGSTKQLEYKHINVLHKEVCLHTPLLMLHYACDICM